MRSGAASPASQATAAAQPAAGTTSPSPVDLERVKLFREFTYLMPRREVEARHGDAVDCAEPGYPESLCVPRIDFLDIAWEAIFIFEEERLIRVVLVSPHGDDLDAKVATALQQDFVPVLMVSGSEVLDLVSVDAVARMERFEHEARVRGDLSVLMLARFAVDLVAATQQPVATSTELLERLPATSRSATYEVYADDGGDTFIRLVFELPRVDELRNAPTERF